jgi:Protein phosphatase 2C
VTTRPPEARDRPAGWRVLTATERGAAHVAAGLPNQDAVAAYPIGSYGAVAAVADGHGHRRHFRSSRGSRLAVAVACEAAQDLAGLIDRCPAVGQVEDETRAVLVPAITGRWRAAVSQDLDGEPFTPAQEASRAATGDDAVIAYGSTLLLAVVWRQWLVLAQIGDGDIVAVRLDGGVLLPVPDDPSLDGWQTTSLCGPRAVDEFRAAVVDLSSTALLGVMLATDGYGNAQLADQWTEVFSQDLAELVATCDPGSLADQLPVWAGRCASGEGSGDDTTIALLLAPDRTELQRDQQQATEPPR